MYKPKITGVYLSDTPFLYANMFLLTKVNIM